MMFCSSLSSDIANGLREHAVQLNTYVHRPYGADKSKQLYSDTKTESTEIFNTIDIGNLCCNDRHLMEVDLEELLERPQNQLDA